MTKKAVITISLIALLIGILVIYKLFDIFTAQSSTLNYTQILADSWKSYKTEFIQNDGRVIDHGNAESSTSEGESYALLQAVYEHDKLTFDNILHWMNNNIARKQDALFAWKWGKIADDQWGVIDTNSASDGDEQTALALVEASRIWGTNVYLNQAQSIIHDIYMHDTSLTNTTPQIRYIVGGNWVNATTTPTIAINPSYFHISAYRLFASIDPLDNWEEVINSSYDALQRCTFDRQNTYQLPPDWCDIDKNSLAISYKDNTSSNMYSYDAFRVFYIVETDALLYKDDRDINYLRLAGNILLQNTTKAYTYDFLHHTKQATDSLAIATGTIAKQYSQDTSLAKTLYQNIIYSHYTSGSFGKSYYDANWSWFITALIGNTSPIFYL